MFEKLGLSLGQLSGGLLRSTGFSPQVTPSRPIHPIQRARADAFFGAPVLVLGFAVLAGQLHLLLQVLDGGLQSLCLLWLRCEK